MKTAVPFILLFRTQGDQVFEMHIGLIYEATNKNQLISVIH